MESSTKKPANKDIYRIFVTGATGLVGLHLVKLLSADGHNVVAMVRQTSNTTNLDEIAHNSASEIRIVRADLLEKEPIVDLIRGCDVVVHTAACIDPHGNEQRLRAINVGGTEKVLAAAIEAGAKQFIQISSLSVIMGDKDCYAITEAEPLHYCREAYANSKIEAEQLVMAAQSRINVTALRPGFIYGPDEKTWLPKLIYNMRARTAMLVDDGSKETNLIYVENLCRAINLAIMNPVAFGQTYNLTDGELVTKRKLFEVICDSLGIPRIRIAIPMPLARLLVDVSSALASIAPPPMKARLAVFSRPALRLVGLNQGFDITKAERELGYTDRIPFAEGMSKTLQSFTSTMDRTGAPVRGTLATR